jgi:hypothetical protein
LAIRQEDDASGFEGGAWISEQVAVLLHHDPVGWSR